MDRQPDVTILPGMSASVTVNFGKEDEEGSSRFLIPSNAVFSDAGGRANVWVVDKAALTVHRRVVRIGQVAGKNKIEIVKGLEPGEVVAVAAIRNLREGMKIQMIEGKIGE